MIPVPVDDLWARDTVPVFVEEPGKLLGKSRDRIEDELKSTLGIKKVIWLAGVRGQDITDAHVDSLVRFSAPGVVLLDQAFPGTPPDVWSRAADQARAVFEDATDARGERLQVVDLPQPDLDRITGRGDAFVSAYANFYVANGAVFMPRFGDAKADDRAKGSSKSVSPPGRSCP